MRPLASTLAAFRSDARGTMAMIAACVCPAVFMAVGAAVDYGRAAQVQMVVSGAADAASLAAAKLIAGGVRDESRIETEARRVFDANFTANAGGLAVTAFDVKPELANNRVVVTAGVDVAAHFMGIAGVEAVPVAATSASHTGKTLEIAMMLDVTGSMGWQTTDGKVKIDVLEGAAARLVRTMLPEGGSGNKVRIAIAPFSSGVNAGALAFTVSKGASKACVQERMSGDQTSDDSPFVSPLGKASACPGDTVVPLTDDRRALLSAVGDLTPFGSTAGHLGTAWSYYLLSPAWAAVYAPANRPAAAGTRDLEKIAILMTDGLYNTWAGVNGEQYLKWDPARAATILRKTRETALGLCGSMKADGITVYTVGFDLRDTTAKELLRSCASTVDGKPAFYDAVDAKALERAYRDITDRILRLRLSS